MSDQESLELRIKKAIVDALMLEDVNAEDIETEAPLFVEGLGLDSIDALELAIALNKEFGLKTKADDENNRDIFYSVATLTKAIQASEAGQDPGEAVKGMAPPRPDDEAES